MSPIEGPPEVARHEKKELTYEDVAAKIRALKDAGVEPSADDPRAQEVWDLIDAYAEQTGAWEGNAESSEKVATIWIDNGWAEDTFFRDKAVEDLTNDMANAQERGDQKLARHLQEKLERLTA
jgi:hypothetical protein